jgi:NlpC/P60 family/Bacterial dipeptidyl-peptidase Sh3 domain
VSVSYDRRVTAARPDLAAAHLKGVIPAERYRRGRNKQVVHATIGLRAAPSLEAALETELLYGEMFTVYELKNGWVWGQAALDSHVGYALADAFGEVGDAASHRVAARATPLLTAPDVKLPSRAILPMNAKLRVAERGERFSRLADGSYVFSSHIAGIDLRAPDWVAVAETLLGTPYLWGGKTFAGIDCSGLVQTALEASGIAAPRDTDLMETALGEPLALDAPLERGDLVFWKGHMGAMVDAARVVHASAAAMQVVIEDFAAARRRILGDGFPVRTIKRLAA